MRFWTWKVWRVADIPWMDVWICRCFVSDFNPCVDPKMRMSALVGYDNQGFVDVRICQRFASNFNPCADPKMRLSALVGYDNQGFVDVWIRRCFVSDFNSCAEPKMRMSVHVGYDNQGIVDVWICRCFVSDFNSYADPKMRMSVPVGYDNQGFLGVSLLLEEVKDSEEKLESSWAGTLWQHSRCVYILRFSLSQVLVRDRGVSFPSTIYVCCWFIPVEVHKTIPIYMLVCLKLLVCAIFKVIKVFTFLVVSWWVLWTFTHYKAFLDRFQWFELQIFP